MITIKIGENHEVTLYNSIHDAPIDRFQAYQKYSLLDSGVGSTIEDVNVHFQKLFQLLQAGKTEEATREATNLFYNINYALEEVNIGSYRFAALVHSIDKEPLVNLTPEGLKEALSKLANFGLTNAHVTNFLEEVKKNFILN
jgi:hypothetical protein